MAKSQNQQKNQKKKGRKNGQQKKRGGGPAPRAPTTVVHIDRAPALPPRRDGRKSTRFGSEIFVRYAKQMENPSNISAPIVLPDVGSQPVCARKYQRTLAFSQAQYSKLRLAMFPNLYLPGFIAGGSAATVPPGASGAVVVQGTLEATDDTPTSTKGVLRFRDSASNATAGALYAVTDNVPTTRKGLSCSMVSGSNVKMTVKYVAHTGVFSTGPTPRLTIYTQGAAPTPWGVALDTGILPENKEMTFNFVITAGGPSPKIAFTITGTNSKLCKLEISMSCDNSQFITSAATTFAPAFAEQIIDQKITVGRVTHMSMFVQNTTSDNLSSGTIVAARVPIGFDLAADDGNWIQSASTLSDNRRYIGPMKNGAYVFWMPEQQDEFNLDNVAEKQRQYADANYLLVEIPDWVAGSTVEVTFTWMVEFYTSSQNFEKIVPPAKSPEFDVVWHMLSRFPAATCNPDHEDYTKSMLDKVKSVVNGAVEFYGKHRELINGIGAAVIAGAAA